MGDHNTECKREGKIRLPLGQQSLVSELFIERPVGARWYGRLAGCWGGSGRSIQCAPHTYHKANGNRRESWVHMETQLDKADLALSSLVPDPGVIWGSGSAPWLCSHSELTAFMQMGVLMGSSPVLAELTTGQPARADITWQALGGLLSPDGQCKRNQG